MAQLALSGITSGIRSPETETERPGKFSLQAEGTSSVDPIIAAAVEYESQWTKAEGCPLCVERACTGSQDFVLIVPRTKRSSLCCLVYGLLWCSAVNTLWEAS